MMIMPMSIHDYDNIILYACDIQLFTERHPIILYGYVELVMVRNHHVICFTHNIGIGE